MSFLSEETWLCILAEAQNKENVLSQSHRANNNSSNMTAVTWECPLKSTVNA